MGQERPQETVEPAEGAAPKARAPQDTSLFAFAKWSALLVAIVLALGFLAAQLLRWLDLDLGR
jgi:hypothetical protein